MSEQQHCFLIEHQRKTLRLEIINYSIMDCYGNLQPGHSATVYLPLCVNTNIVYTIEEVKFPGLYDSRHNSEPCMMISPEFEAVLRLTDGVDDSAVLPESDIRDLEAQGELYHLLDELDFHLENADIPPESFLETLINVLTDAEVDTTPIPDVFQTSADANHDDSDCVFEFAPSKIDYPTEQYAFLLPEHDASGSSKFQRMWSTESCVTNSCNVGKSQTQKKKRRFSNISGELNEVVSGCSKRRKLSYGNTYVYSSGVQNTDSSHLSPLDVLSQSYSAHSPHPPTSLRAC